MAYNILSANPFAVLEAEETPSPDVEGSASVSVSAEPQAAPTAAATKVESAGARRRPGPQGGQVTWAPTAAVDSSGDAKRGPGRDRRGEKIAKEVAKRDTNGRFAKQADTRGPTNKRVFDRHSGTGRGATATDKRGGNGKYNWGAPGVEVEASWRVVDESPRGEEVPRTESKPAAEGEPKEEEAAVPAPKGEPEEPKVVEEEEPIEIDYEEYMKMVSHRAPKTDALVLRKAGEGEDVARWGEAQLMKRDEEGVKIIDLPMDSGKGHRKGTRKDKERKKIVTQQMNIRFMGDEAPPEWRL